MGLTPKFRLMATLVALTLIPTIFGCASSAPKPGPTQTGEPPAYPSGPSPVEEAEEHHEAGPPRVEHRATTPAPEVVTEAAAQPEECGVEVSFTLRTVNYATPKKLIAFVKEKQIMFDVEWGDIFLCEGWRDKLSEYGMRVGAPPAGWFLPELNVVYGTSCESLQKFVTMMDKERQKKLGVDAIINDTRKSCDENCDHFGVPGEHVQLRYARHLGSHFSFTAKVEKPTKVLTLEAYKATLQP